MQRNLRTLQRSSARTSTANSFAPCSASRSDRLLHSRGASDRYTDRYETWLNTAAHPQVVAAVLLVDADAGQLRIRRWNPESHVFEPAEWPARSTNGTHEFEEELAEFTAGRPPTRRAPLRGDDRFIITPLRNLVVPAVPTRAPVPQTVTPVFGFTSSQLNMAYIREQILPELAQRHFIHAEGNVYRVFGHERGRSLEGAVSIGSGRARRTRTRRRDRRTPRPHGSVFFFNRPPRPGDPVASRDAGASRTGLMDLPREAMTSSDDGCWSCSIESGSLEAAVTAARHRNLGISFGVLLLLTVSVALLVDASRRAQRLARQQMEFVAGVSHELRTPVAVIRSAAENLRTA